MSCSSTTSKPEELIMRVLQIATDPNDLVLDAYLGPHDGCSRA